MHTLECKAHLRSRAGEGVENTAVECIKRMKHMFWSQITFYVAQGNASFLYLKNN